VTTINKKYEDRHRQHKALNLHIIGLTAGLNPIEIVINFIQNTLHLTDIPVDRVWAVKDFSLFIRLCSVDHQLSILKFKKILSSLQDRIFIDEDLTRMQSQELAAAYKEIFEAWKMGHYQKLSNLDQRCSLSKLAQTLAPFFHSQMTPDAHPPTKKKNLNDLSVNMEL